ncbi:MAG: beta-galactosidase [bacterium]|nr:beta-galactosidase [bacterium]
MKKILLIAFIIGVGVAFYLGRALPLPEAVTYGVTFSYLYAEKTLGLDWKKVYVAMLDDLKIRKLRIPAYWSEIEKEEGKYDFANLDWQIREAEKRGASIILVIGRKVPRWPECHEPAWVLERPRGEQDQKLFQYIRTIMGRYKDNPDVSMWQVENEPYLPFGECPLFLPGVFEKEIALVKSLDSRPVLLTDSGELSIWAQTYRRADVFGTTMYRTIWNTWTGTFTYPLPPGYFRMKRRIMEKLYGIKPMIVVELQAEPWAPTMPQETTLEEQYKSMDVNRFRKNVSYARNTAFDTFYFWGVEWWYWLGEKHGNWEIWNEAKELFKKNTSPVF